MKRRHVAVIAVLGLDLLVAGIALMFGFTLSAGIALTGAGLMVLIVALFGLDVE